MAITADQVHAAAAQVQATTGKTPTVAAVRAHLGTGSFSTITPILKAWVEAQGPATVPASATEPTPASFTDALLAAAPALWTVAANIANEHLATERAAMDIERADLQAALADSTATGDQIAADLDTAQAKIDELTTRINDMATTHAAALEEQTTARTAAEQATAVLRATNEQMQTRIDDLTATGKTNVSNLETANRQIDQLRADLAAQVQITHAAENKTVASQATATAQAAQIKDLQATITDHKAELVTLKTDHAAQVKATHAAENRAATAEATTAALTAQVKDLQGTIEQLRTPAPAPVEAKTKQKKTATAA